MPPYVHFMKPCFKKRTSVLISRLSSSWFTLVSDVLFAALKILAVSALIFFKSLLLL